MWVLMLEKVFCIIIISPLELVDYLLGVWGGDAVSEF